MLKQPTNSVFAQFPKGGNIRHGEVRFEGSCRLRSFANLHLALTRMRWLRHSWSSDPGNRGNLILSLSHSRIACRNCRRISGSTLLLRYGKHGEKVRQFKSLWLPFKDDMKPRPKWFYRRAMRFYRKAMQKPSAKVFVMCHHGVCRSASLTYTLLRAAGADHYHAQRAILRVRPRAVICRAYRESGEIFLALEWANKNLERTERRKCKVGART